MKKKSLIITLIIILILQAIMPIKTNAFAENREVTSTPAKIEKQKSKNTIFDDSITYKWEYHEEESLMAYGLYTPSNANELESVPMILYLHGSGETAVSEDSLKSTGLPGVWDWEQWNLENFSAYVLCPHLRDWNGSWQTGQAVSDVTELLEEIIAKYNIDTENIVICGESRGGTGALYMANIISKYFSKCVAFSAFYNGPFNTSMDTLCFYSYVADDASEYAGSWKSAFGEDKVFSLGCGHGSVGRVSLNSDEGKFERCWKCTVMVVLI